MMVASCGAVDAAADGRALREGDLVWVPRPDSSTPAGGASSNAFVAGRVVHLDARADGGEVLVQIEAGNSSRDGGSRAVPRSDVRRRFEGSAGTCADCTSLPHLNDACILDNLRRRLMSSEIYTYTASVLLAVNPCRDIEGLYGDEQCERYRGKNLGALPPHPYAIADTAYRQLCRDRKSQAVLISGESGAGKTETAKIIKKYLAHTSGTGCGLAETIQRRVLQAQPILESFGNAATVRNKNSSRFGKYNRIFFDSKGTLVDAGITTYLLESSRVVMHAPEERTYHVFYEMLRGLEDTELENMGLERGRRYRLLGASPEDYAEGDVKNYVRLRSALINAGLDDAGVQRILRVLAGLVHLGDIGVEDENGELRLREKLEGEAEAAVMVDEEKLAWVAQLLGMSAADLARVLQYRQIKIQTEHRTDCNYAPRKPAQFTQTLHSLIKAIYRRLFDQIVRRINESFRELRPEASGGKGNNDTSEAAGAPPPPPSTAHRRSSCSASGISDSDETRPDAWRHIGILDIYGFERLQKNSFEQLCINLANERLQQYFVEKMLSAEQVFYAREGLPWSELSLPDSTPVVGCISQAFATLDDISQRAASGVGIFSDERYCELVLNDAAKHQLHKQVLRPLPGCAGRGRQTAGQSLYDGFMIRHYAGSVDYVTRGWGDKNNDKLAPECEVLIGNSDSETVKSLVDETAYRQAQAPDKGRGQQFRSISKKYMSDLETLLKTLSESQLHCIRCFKPSASQKPGVFDDRFVLDQVVQCGTIELVRIMHDGFPYRCPFADVVERFKGLLPDSFQRYGTRTFLEALMLAYEVPADQWALGMSRLFLKAGQFQKLEELHDAAAAPDPKRLAEIVRGIVGKRWKRAVHAVTVCGYLPKMLARAKAKKGLAWLYRATLLSTKILRLQRAARARIRERRSLSRCRWTTAIRQVVAQERRRRRMAKRVCGLFHMAAAAHRWASRGRIAAKETRRLKEEAAAERRRLAEEEEERRRAEEAAAAEAERQRLEELRLAEEAAAAEAERQRLEELRLAEEAAAAEAERQRLEELRLAEEAAAAEAERQRLEELRLAEEAAAEAERQRLEELRRAEEAAAAEAERQRLEEEERRRAEEAAAAAAAAAEAERQRRKQEAEAAAARKLNEETLHFQQLITEQASPQPRQRRSSAAAAAAAAGASPLALSGNREVNDAAEAYRFNDTPSTAVPLSPQGLDARLRQLEEDYRQQQEQVKKQMHELRRRNDEIEEKMRSKGEEQKLSAELRFRPSSRQSPLPDLQLSPGFERGTGFKAAEALRCDLFGSNSCGVGTAFDPLSTQDIHKQQQWWRAQRGCLLDELFPDRGNGRVEDN